MKKKQPAKRYDAFVDQNTGRGTNRDKLTSITGSSNTLTPEQARLLYRSNGFIQNVVNAPAEDATREWISIKTNRDDLKISRLIINRLTKLRVQSKLADLIRFSRMYCEGAILYFQVKSDLPQTNTLLSLPLPENIFCIESLNVIEPDHFSISLKNFDPLAKNFNQPDISIQAINIHPTRYEWLVKGFNFHDQKGISAIQTIYDAVLAQDTALWSVNSLIYELAVSVFKSPQVGNMNPDEIFEFLTKMKAVMNTQSAIAITDNEDLTKKTLAINGVKELFDFIFENLAGLSRIPKARLMGAAQGVIKSGQFDILSYYDSISQMQENDLRPIIEKIISMVIRETEGEIYRTLGGNISQLDWEFEFGSLWKPDPLEEADTRLKTAQADKLYIDSAVVEPSVIRKKRFEELADYTWENPPLDFATSLPLKKPIDSELSEMVEPLKTA